MFVCSGRNNILTASFLLSYIILWTPLPINNPTLVVFNLVKRFLLALTLSTSLILPSFSPPFNATKLWTFNSPGLSLVCLVFHDLIQLKPYKPPLFKLLSSSQSTLHTVSFYLCILLVSDALTGKYHKKWRKDSPSCIFSASDSPKPTLALWSQLHTSVNRKQMLNCNVWQFFPSVSKYVGKTLFYHLHGHKYRWWINLPLFSPFLGTVAWAEADLKCRYSHSSWSTNKKSVTMFIS